MDDFRSNDNIDSSNSSNDFHSYKESYTKVKIKIFKHKVKVNIDDDVIKFKNYFKEHGIELDISVEETDVPLLDSGIKLFNPSVGKYDVVYYVFNWKDFQLGSFAKTYPLFPNMQAVYQGTDLSNDNVDFIWKSLSHEFLHCLFYKYNIHHLDPMDGMYVGEVWQPYYKNDQPYAPDGNFARAWEILKPYISSMFVRKVTLTRTIDDGVQTLGNLDTEGFNCKTLERPYLNNQKNISSIPPGEYKCKYTFSPRFLKYTYEVLNVPNRSGIRIHSANLVSQLNGCIAIGDSYKDINADGKVDVLNSRATISTFEKFMNYKEFMLVIK